jgi:hypothetical protein
VRYFGFLAACRNPRVDSISLLDGAIPLDLDYPRLRVEDNAAELEFDILQHFPVLCEEWPGEKKTSHKIVLGRSASTEPTAIDQ